MGCKGRTLDGKKAPTPPIPYQSGKSDIVLFYRGTRSPLHDSVSKASLPVSEPVSNRRWAAAASASGKV